MSVEPWLPGENTVTITSAAGTLEAIVSVPDEVRDPRIGCVCHPHPLFEGSMHNKVVTTVTRAWRDAGLISVRFNFRGVGKSTGSYGEGAGEIADLLAVLAWCEQTWPAQLIVLAGFSFGGFVAANGASQFSVERLITIAPAVTHFTLPASDEIACPWLVVQGDQDDVVATDAVLAWYEKLNPAPTLKVFAGAGHFFHGRLPELKQCVSEFTLQDKE